MLPLPFLNLKPMLATPSKTVAATPVEAVEELTGTHVFDLKHDGVRALAFVQDGVASLVNRVQLNITYRYPEVIAALEDRFAKQDVVLDGELLCFVNGKPIFDAIHRRDAQTNPAKVIELSTLTPATYVAFDLLYLGDRVDVDATPVGIDMRRWPYEGRLGALAGLGLSPTLGAATSIMATIASDNGKLMWDFVQEHGLEGLIAKRKDSQYRSRRDPAWVKIKDTKRISVLVTGYEPGKKGGRRENMIGALKLGLLDANGKLTKCGKVGTGFKDRDLIMLKQLIDAYAADPTGHAPVIVEVEYLEVTTDGVLRFPSWKGLRTDVPVHDCTVEQLERA